MISQIRTLTLGHQALLAGALMCVVTALITRTYINVDNRRKQQTAWRA